MFRLPETNRGQGSSFVLPLFSISAVFTRAKALGFFLFHLFRPAIAAEGVLTQGARHEPAFIVLVVIKGRAISHPAV